MAAPAGAAPKCGRTQEKLDELKARIKKVEFDYDDFFFKGTQTEGDALILKGMFNVPDNDVRDRCKECGQTIGQHQSSAHPSAPREDSAEVLHALVHEAFSTSPHDSMITRAAASEVKFRATLIDRGFPYSGCCVLEQVRPRTVVPPGTSVGAHIIPRKMAGHLIASLCRLGDPLKHNGLENGLVMTRALELEFDEHNWCLLHDRDAPKKDNLRAYRIRMLCRDLRGPIPQLNVHESDKRIGAYDVEWEDLAGKLVYMPLALSHTAITFHAVNAFRKHQLPEREATIIAEKPPKAVRESIEAYLRDLPPYQLVEARPVPATSFDESSVCHNPAEGVGLCGDCGEENIVYADRHGN